MKKNLIVAVAIATLALTGACGGGGDRPSKDDLAKTLSDKDEGQGNTFNKKQAECAAEVLLDSKLSDKALTALAEGDEAFKPSTADTKAQTAIIDDLRKCLAP